VNVVKKRLLKEIIFLNMMVPHNIIMFRCGLFILDCMIKKLKQDKNKMNLMKNKLLFTIARIQNCWEHHQDGSDLLKSHEGHLFSLVFNDLLHSMRKVDFDPAINGKLNRIKQKLDEKYKKYCEEEKKYWEELDDQLIKEYNMQGTSFMKGMLSERHLPYYKMYVRDKVDAYTKIVSLIQELIKRLKDYQEETMEG